MGFKGKTQTEFGFSTIYITDFESECNNLKDIVKIVLVQSSYFWDYLFVKSYTEDQYNNESFTLFTLKNGQEKKIYDYYEKCIQIAIENQSDIICFPEFIYMNDNSLREQLNTYKEKINIITGTYITTQSLNRCELYFKSLKDNIYQDKLYPYVAIGEYFRSQRDLNFIKTCCGNIVVCICIDIRSKDIFNAIKNRKGTPKEVDIIFSPSYNIKPNIYKKLRKISKKLKTCVIFINDATTLVNSIVYIEGKERKLKKLVKSRPDLFYFELDLRNLRKRKRFLHLFFNLLKKRDFLESKKILGNL